MKYIYKVTKNEGLDSLKIELPKELEIVATFLENDIQGIPIKWWLQQIDEVLNNLKEYNEFQGTLCAIQVKKDETILVDLYSIHDPNICKIETTELRNLIEVWGQAQKMYKDNN
ncbi:hypothetical protein [Bacillus pseudomycoides]|uniref:hypothetical protein n=1 Tax=Bacillus pseudomycoides TaxID=64104 RepID=UPI000BF1E389|nr:hypothetical protein [Bacillus pseudomycoides]PEJ28563.1 hypothetical protein CN677_26900 [Bacillus pseudomycoides]PHA85115.1 hypothetical protein COE78_22100 [Bacillus pseudomycoides]PHC66287.1 hypothetical protein COF38_28575 [Bacillus pseudomycoides]